MIHGDLRPKYVCLETDGQPNKLADRLGNALSPSRVQIYNIKKGLSLYASPVIFNSIILRKKKIKHNPFRSECFSLGMIILEAGLLRSVQGVYDVAGKVFQLEVLLDLV